MIESIKITSLNNIGSNIAYNSIFPVVDTSVSPPITNKANLQIIGNAILSGAGGSYFVPALASIYAQSVTNAAQPNITSVGTLSSLAVNGTVNLGYINDISIYGGDVGQVLSTDGTGNLYWSSGSPSNIANLVVDNITYSPDVWLKTVDGETQSIYISPDDGNSELYLGVGSAGTSLTGFSDNGLALLGAGADIALTNTANIRTSRNTNNYTWVFDDAGNLLTPGNIVGPSNANFVIYSNSGAHDFTFADDGTFYAPDNVVLGGTSISIGPGANTLAGLANAVLVASSNSDAYIQGVINNVSDIGSADWVAEGHHGNDDAGWADFGFTSAAFLDPNYTITGPGDGYIFVQAYLPEQAPSIGGGNLVLATGENGTTKDIIFSTGGFATENELARFDHANSLFHLTREGSGIQFYDGSIQTTAVGGITSNGTFCTLPDFLEFVGGTLVRTGQTGDGVFFDGDAGDPYISYPVRTNFAIGGMQKVVVTVDMVVNDECSDFGLCVFESGIQPEWAWDPNTTRIAAQYDCTTPAILTLDDSTYSGYNIPAPGTYRVRFTYDPNNSPNVTLETLDTSDNVLNTITIDGTLNTSAAYYIGFSADQDSTNLRTYIQNLTIAIDGGNTYTDSLQLSGGGNANTGNVTFNNINIIGTGNLHLQPDPANAGAFLDVYLTTGPDIHIAGNGENLILGGDNQSNVAVNANGSVSIQSTNFARVTPTTIVISGADFVAVNITYTVNPIDSTSWLPAGYNPATDPYIQYDGEQWGIFVPGFGQALYVNTGPLTGPLIQWDTNPPLGSIPPIGTYFPYINTNTWTFDTSGDLHNPGNLTLNGGTIFGGVLTEVVTNTNITNIELGNVGNNYPLVVTFDTSPFYYPIRGTAVIANVTTPAEINGTWYFEAWYVNQIALFTDDTYTSYEYGTGWSAWTGGGDVDITINDPATDVKINSGGYQTTFANDGNLVLPTSTYPNVAAIVSPFNSNILLYAGGNNSYVFGENGQITFPTLNVDLHNGGIQSAQTLQFADPNTQAVITGPTPPAGSGYNAQRLIIQGQRGDGAGEGGDVYLWAGDADINGGDIKIYAGDADNASVGYGGYINIEGGRGYNEGGYINIIAGQSTSNVGAYARLVGGQGGTTGGTANVEGGYGSVTGGEAALKGGYGGAGPGGNVTIVGGGSANGLSEYGNVNIDAGASTWKFDNAGNLTVPANSTIKSQSGDLSLYATGNVNIESKGHTFVFDTDTVGRFIMPPSGIIAGSSDVGNGLNVFVGNIETEVGNSWNFGVDGNLTAPGNIITSGSGGDLTLTGGNITGANIVTANFFAGDGSNLSNISGSNVSGVVANANYANTAGTVTATGNINANSYYINNLATPMAGTDAATKAYVDSASTGLNIHDPVNAATVEDLATTTGGTVQYNNGVSGVGANLVIFGGTLTSIDTVSLSTNMRVMIKDEANAVWNGVYVYNNNTTLTRATDFDDEVQASGGDYFFVEAGYTNGKTSWVQITLDVVVGVDPMNFVQFSAAGSYNAGTGLTLTGSTFSVNASQTQITSVGTLSSLSVTNKITAGQFQGDGGNLSNIQGANVIGTAANANYSTYSGTASIANSISVGNVSGIGNIATINLDGNASNILYGNGAFAAVPISYGNSNVATFLGSYGSNTITTTGNVQVGNIIGNGQALTGINGANVTGQVSYAAVANSVAGANVTGQVSYAAVANSVAGANVSGTVANATNAAALLQNTSSATTVYPTFTTSSANGNSSAVFNTGISANLSNASITATTFVGALSGAATTSGTVTANSQPNITSVGTLSSLAVTGNTTSGNFVGVFANGNSNVSIPVANGNVNISAVGNANILVVTGTGANITGTADVTGNVSGANFTTVGGFVIARTSALNQYIDIHDNDSGGAYFISYSAANAAKQMHFDTTTDSSNTTPSAGTLGFDWRVLGAIQANLSNTGFNLKTGLAYYINNTSVLTNTTLGSGVVNSSLTSVGTLSSLAVTGNVTAGNIIGIFANGNSNVSIPSANGNVNISVAGTANVLVVTGTGANITGTANVSGNISGANVFSTNDVWANSGNFRTSASTANIVNATPTIVNIAGGASTAVNIGNASGLVNLSGNVQGNTNGFAIGYRDIPQLSFTGNTSIALTDAGKHYYSTLSTANTLTISNSATTNFAIGAAINIVNQGTGNILINAASGVTLYLAGNSTAANRTLTSYGVATIQKVATDTWFVLGVGVS